MPKMRHPETGAEIDVAESAVPFHLASGWAVVEAAVVGEGDSRGRTVETTDGPTEPAGEDRRDVPAKSATKAEWEQAARDAGVPEDEITSMTKDQLVARVTGESKE